jgi:hypothetical protein
VLADRVIEFHPSSFEGPAALWPSKYDTSAYELPRVASRVVIQDGDELHELVHVSSSGAVQSSYVLATNATNPLVPRESRLVVGDEGVYAGDQAVGATTTAPTTTDDKVLERHQAIGGGAYLGI